MTAKLKLIKSTEEFRRLEPIWNNLLSKSPSDNYFLTWDWLWNWWRLYALKNDILSIFVFERGDRIVGIAPFYVRKRLIAGIYPVRLMMFIGTQEGGVGDVGSDYLDFIYQQGEEEEIVKVLFTAVRDHNLCDEMYFSKMISSSKTFDLLKDEGNRLGCLVQIDSEYVSPYITLPLTWDDYLNDLTSSMRYKIRNERRKCDKLGSIKISKVDSSQNIALFLTELIRLHDKRWKARGMTGAFSSAQFRGFHEYIMPRMLEDGKLELTLLSENGETRAVIYNIVYNNKVYFYQSGIDTFETKAAFGYVLHSHCIEDAIGRGLSEYDFLPKGTTDDYKDRFSNNHRIVANLYIARQWAVKQFVRVEESARSVYHNIKPFIQKIR